MADCAIISPNWEMVAVIGVMLVAVLLQVLFATASLCGCNYLASSGGPPFDSCWSLGDGFIAMFPEMWPQAPKDPAAKSVISLT